LGDVFKLIMKNIIEEITKLTNEWYILIGPLHHKDKCCHWYIETKWSYGYPPKYSVQHWGYILDDIVIECDSYDEALLKLKEILTEKIEEEKKFEEENNENGW
jgi:hypothetical protein